MRLGRAPVSRASSGSSGSETESKRPTTEGVTNPTSSCPSLREVQGPARGHARLVGNRLDGTAERLRLEKLGARGLPPWPPVMAAEVPPAIVLTEKVSSLETVRHLAGCYRETARVCLGRKTGFMTYGSPLKHKQAPRLLEMAELFRGEFVAPAAWVRWSFEVFKVGVLPSAAWVFSPKRWATHFSWFCDCRGAFEDGRLVYAAAYRSLTNLLENMWRELLRVRPQTRGELLDIVDRYFPEDDYEAHVRRARAATLRLQQEIDQAMVERGFYVG